MRTLKAAADCGEVGAAMLRDPDDPIATGSWTL